MVALKSAGNAKANQNFPAPLNQFFSGNKLSVLKKKKKEKIKIRKNEKDIFIISFPLMKF